MERRQSRKPVKQLLLCSSISYCINVCTVIFLPLFFLSLNDSSLISLTYGIYSNAIWSQFASVSIQFIMVCEVVYTYTILTSRKKVIKIGTLSQKFRLFGIAIAYYKINGRILLKFKKIRRFC